LLHLDCFSRCVFALLIAPSARLSSPAALKRQCDYTHLTFLEVPTCAIDTTVQTQQPKLYRELLFTSETWKAFIWKRLARFEGGQDVTYVPSASSRLQLPAHTWKLLVLV
jgi:hypothetical protein